ncbi:hypothetical protein E2P81_ATG07326 [Venturia nashicola]|nr:hypothetical protein E2P81_ATG07326 [Venturia nashicola]
MDRLIQAIVDHSKIELFRGLNRKAHQRRWSSLWPHPRHACRAIGPAGSFAPLAVDETKITPSGATISIVNQKIEITDMTAFLAFIRTMMQEDKGELFLLAKSATIKGLLMRKSIEFSKPAEVLEPNEY